MRFQAYDGNDVTIQPDQPDELRKVRALLQAAAAQYDRLDEVIVNVPEEEIPVIIAALDDAITENGGDAGAPVRLSLRNFTCIARIIGAVGQDYPALDQRHLGGVSGADIGNFMRSIDGIWAAIPEPGEGT